MEKQKLENQGWTVDGVRERIKGCQRNRREFKNCPENSRFTYRFLNVCQYLQNRNRLKILLTP